MSKLENKIRGIVFVHLDQGGGFPWAFNDTSYNYENKYHYVCKKCNRFWDKEKYPEEVEIIDGDYCKQKDHDFKLTPKIYWSYEGIHYLKNGDYLRIFDKDSSEKIIWEGKIKFKITQKKFTFNGKEIETTRPEIESENATYIDFANWFIEEYPGELTKKSETSDTNL